MLNFITCKLDLSLFSLCILPELFLLSLVLILIITAVLTINEKKAYLLTSFLNISLISYAILFGYLGEMLQLELISNNITLFFCYQTLKVNSLLIVIKMLLILMAFISLVLVKRYLLIYQLNNYEYPLFIHLATFGMFISISANNWMVLFLSLELQALCFLVLFAWNRRSEKSINAALKFTVINFIASTLILLGLIEMVLYTQTFNMYLSNPFFFTKNLFSLLLNQTDMLWQSKFLIWELEKTMFALDYNYYFDLKQMFYAFSSANEASLQAINVYKLSWLMFDNPTYLLTSINDLNHFHYNPLWSFVGLLFVLGFGMKLGLVPFGFWLQDLYLSVPLPILTFFGTAPKLTYITILLSVYINLFAFINPESFLYPLMVLGSITMVVANVMMFKVYNNLLILLAWSSIANMGLLCFLMGKYPLEVYSLNFIIYYVFSTLFFFVILQYLVLKDNSQTKRHPIYFTDLSVVSAQLAYKPIFFLLVLSLLNSFGIPPFLVFWMKFSAMQGLLLNTVNFVDWLLVLSLLLVTIIGGFSYIRVLYSLLSENQNLGLQQVYWPNIYLDYGLAVFGFVLLQLTAFFCYHDLTLVLNTNLLLTQHIFIIN